MYHDLDGKDYKSRHVIAKKNNKIIGLSFYWIRYSTWKGKFLFLEDFIIKEECRGNGVGSKLFEEVHS